MNAINWFEIPTTDFVRATRFYEQILATSLRLDDSFPDIKLAILPSSEHGVGGALVQLAQGKPNPDGVRIYLNGGDDLAAILDRVTSAGGKVLMPKTFLREEIGYIGLFSDSEGNVIGLHSVH
jgi:predicted enzyme related to lactoylglutathione lyase